MRLANNSEAREANSLGLEGHIVWDTASPLLNCGRNASVDHIQMNTIGLYGQ